MRPGNYVLCTLLCILVWGYAHAQEIPVTAYPADSRKIEMQQFVWQYNDSATCAGIQFTLINHANLPVKRIQLSVVAHDKSGLTLQHKEATIRQLNRNIVINPEEQQTVLFPRAFRSVHIDQIYIRQVVVEFSNGSLEILQR